jgi:hypothetical protein
MLKAKACRCAAASKQCTSATAVTALNNRRAVGSSVATLCGARQTTEEVFSVGLSQGYNEDQL